MTYHSGNQLIDPALLFEKVQLHEGMHVADFGCGKTGHIVFPAAQVVGERGVVYAVDILKDILEMIRKRAASEAMHNVAPVWADLERKKGVLIAEKTVDIIFMINVLFHFKDYRTTLEEAARILKPKARIVVVDWKKKLGMLGPDEKQMVRFGEIEEWARSTNFVIQEDCDIGPYHRCMILFRHD